MGAMDRAEPLPRSRKTGRARGHASRVCVLAGKEAAGVARRENSPTHARSANGVDSGRAPVREDEASPQASEGDGVAPIRERAVTHSWREPPTMPDMTV